MCISSKDVCAVYALQWRVIDEKGNKVKSQEVLEMPKWCIHPFSTFIPFAKLLTFEPFRLYLLSVVSGTQDAAIQLALCLLQTLTTGRS